MKNAGSQSLVTTLVSHILFGCASLSGVNLTMNNPLTPVEAISARIKHVLRVAWLRSLYWPFWRSVNAFRRGAIAMRGRVNLVTDDELWLITQELDEHPDGWDHPCMCATCRSYGDD